MSDHYRFPTREEKQLGPELVGKKIAIYWDGDKVYYPGFVTGYDESTHKFEVEYEEDSTHEKFDEDLRTSGWKIWGGTDAEYAAERENKVCLNFLLNCHALVCTTIQARVLFG